MGESEPGVTGRPASEGASGRHSADQQRAEEGRRRRVHVLGAEQAGSQRPKIRRRRSDR